MPDERSKYDTNPLDPDYARKTEEVWGETRPFDARGTEGVPGPQPQPDPQAEAPTRFMDERLRQPYPSVLVPPVYQPPAQSRTPPNPAQPGANYQQPNVPPPPASNAPTSRAIGGLGIPENVALVGPYTPFYIGIIVALVELLMVPRREVRVRYHAAQGLALQLAIFAFSMALNLLSGLAGGRFGGTLFWLASTVFLIISMVRVWRGEPHHLAPLDEPARWLNRKLEPKK